MMGTTPESYIGSEDRWFNTTTVRYGVNHKAWNSTGVGEDYYACNRPIQSAHPGGAQVVLADGAVRFLGESLALADVFRSRQPRRRPGPAAVLECERQFR